MHEAGELSLFDTILLIDKSFKISEQKVFTLWTSSSETVGGLGGQLCLRLFFDKARDIEPETRQTTTTKDKIDFILIQFSNSTVNRFMRC